MKAHRGIPAALLALGLLLTAACSAHNETNGASVSPAASSAGAMKPAAPGSFTEGKQYVRIARTAQQPAATGPVVLVEVFSYGCPHCAEFAPFFDKLRAQLPKDVQVRYMPAVFNDDWKPYAQAFYAVRQLGALDATHDALFKAMMEHYPLNSLQDLAGFYANHGVDQQKFLAAANSPQTQAQIDADTRIEQGWGIDETPTLVVGRLQDDTADAPVVAEYRSAEIHSYEELAQVGNWLVQQAERKGAGP
ncbi:MAG: thiol:disulfide interchange protein DsbA/DsbL [Proteobacteria bacterium]|nr:thiol:disulfide interchange protein DsbA/DsbL [Pseudomonadota bacterium]